MKELLMEGWEDALLIGNNIWILLASYMKLQP